MKAAAETTLAIAADPKRLGARIGITAVLHTWGSALTHHPHVHMIVPGGGLSLDGARWIASRSNFLVHVNVLARLFRGKMLVMLMHAHAAGQLQFFNTHAGLADRRAFKRFVAPLRHIKWVVSCKAPFAGPKQVLRYLSRYTHRVAFSNRRLIAADDVGIAFRWKDYRVNGTGRWKTMRLHPHEFIRRWLLHVLPKGFHRIRHYGLFASANRADSIAKAREILVLRQQINVLRRSAPKRPPLRGIDRLIFVGLYRLIPDVRGALTIIKPDTVIRWHRAGFRAYWRRKSTSRGRPKVAHEIRQLIRDMSLANPGCPADPRRTAQARYRCWADECNQVHGAAEAPAVPGLEDYPAQSCRRNRRDGPFRGADDLVPASVWPADLAPRSPPDPVAGGHRASDRRVDCPAVH
jgi:hypothetical protein